MNAYVVTAGEYSDYRILAVFTDKPSADSYAAAFDRTVAYEPAVVEEYPLDSPPSEWTMLMVRMDKEGKVISVEQKLDTPAGFRCWDVNGNLVWTVATDDEDRAIKVVNEKRSQLIALGRWNDQSPGALEALRADGP